MKKSLAMQQTDKVKKQQKRIPQITTRLEQIAELFFNPSGTETFSDKLLKTILADSLRFSASDGQEPEKTEILR